MKREPLMEINPSDPSNNFYFKAYHKVLKWDAPEDKQELKERCLFLSEKLGKRLKLEGYTPDFNAVSHFDPKLLAIGIQTHNTPPETDGYWFVGYRLHETEDGYYWKGFIYSKSTLIDVDVEALPQYSCSVAPRKNLWKETKNLVNLWEYAEEIVSSSN